VLSQCQQRGLSPARCRQSRQSGPCTEWQIRGRREKRDVARIEMHFYAPERNLETFSLSAVKIPAGPRGLQCLEHGLRSVIFGRTRTGSRYRCPIGLGAVAVAALAAARKRAGLGPFALSEWRHRGQTWPNWCSRCQGGRPSRLRAKNRAARAPPTFRPSLRDRT